MKLQDISYKLQVEEGGSCKILAAREELRVVSYLPTGRQAGCERREMKG